jgi:outer membrane immunogenic protein
MRLIPGSILIVALGMGVAQAADLPMVTKAPAQVVAYNWTGFYVGGNAGYAWGHSNLDPSFSCLDGPGGSCDVSDPQNLANINAANTRSVSPRGFTGGVQAGYNLQMGATVFGVEADFNALDLHKSVTSPVTSVTTGNLLSGTQSVDTDWLFTFRGRVGWLVTPTALIYATGGLAVTDLKVGNSYATTNSTTTFGTGSSSESKTMLGWTAGAGAEWAIFGNWRAKVEYLYVDFGSVSTTARVNDGANAFDNVFTTSADLKAHIARAGINYRF